MIDRPPIMQHNDPAQLRYSISHVIAQVIPLRRPHILPIYVRQILAMTAADDEADERKGEIDDDANA